MATVRPLLAAGAVLALGACGGPSEQEFVADAEHVCRQAQRQAAGVPRPAVDASAAQTVRYIRRLAALSRDEFAELGQIEPPERLTARYDAFLASGRQGTRLLEQLAATTQAGDPGGSERVVRHLDALTRRANRQALAIGLRRCGS